VSTQLTDWPALRSARTLAETDEYLVLDKPAGVSVTGERHDTDLVRIAKAAGEHLIPVHRIDKVTSGVVLLAKTQAAHGPLTRQFTVRTVRKSYLAITRSVGLPEAGTVDLPLSVGRKNRVRVAAPREDITRDEASAHWSVPPVSVRPRSFPSFTSFTRLWQGTAHTALAVFPTTGRRHQIRVHLAWIGHPIAGDPLFPAPEDAALTDSTLEGDAPTEATPPAATPPAAGEGVPSDGAVRTCLHAWRLSFDDLAGQRVTVQAVPEPEFWAPVATELPPAERIALLRA
jgi:tRNA pseudouridine32 synthase/23S rRNA pseudouridine746 synthase/23S rRNA pseudouridine1911/1915/1917 synthase